MAGARADHGHQMANMNGCAQEMRKLLCADSNLEKRAIFTGTKLVREKSGLATGLRDGEGSR